MIFSADENGIVVLRASDADRYAGGLVKWEYSNEPESSTEPSIFGISVTGDFYGGMSQNNDLSEIPWDKTKPSIISISVEGDYYGGMSRPMKPSGNTWDKTLSGRLSFTVNITTAGTYAIYSKLLTYGVDAWIWIDVNGQDELLGTKNQGRMQFNTTTMDWQDAENNSVVFDVGTYEINVYSLSSSVLLSSIGLVPTTASSTQLSSSSQVATDAPAVIEDQTYMEWRKDVSRGHKRIMLVQLDHDSGTEYVASEPYIDYLNNPHHDWIVSSPYLEFSIDEIDVGDIELVNTDLTVNWLNFNWRGFRTRWYYGDVDWAFAKFKQIASATIDTCQLVSDRNYRFNYIDNGQRYNRTFHSGDDVTRSESVEDAVAWIMSHEGSGSYQFLNVPASVMETQLVYDITESSNMETELQKIATSIKASIRMTQTGYMEFVIPDKDSTAGFELLEPSIPSVRVVDTINAMQTVVVNYANDGSTEAETAANTGSIDETVEFDTYLANEADAQALAQAHAIEYSSARNVWELSVAVHADVIQPADFGTAVHSEIGSVSGVVQRVRREPLSNISLVEIIEA